MAIEPWIRPKPSPLRILSPPPQVVIALRTRPFLASEVEAAGFERQEEVPRGVDTVNPVMVIHPEAMKVSVVLWARRKEGESEAEKEELMLSSIRFLSLRQWNGPSIEHKCQSAPFFARSDV